MNLKLKYVIPLIISFSCIVAQDPIVNLAQGRIVGTKVYTDKSLIPIEIYYGIPYATPPIGRYRFSPADGKPLPVLVILYSESWIRGGVSLPCQDLAAEDMVVVTVGYRLHLLGFFTLESISARGNLALLDQYLAFLWIRDNIGAFGGDSNAITVLGHSAGADSVLHHLISPRSKGLFQRAVIMSPIDIWKLIDEHRDSDAIKADHTSREVALSLGCTSKLDLEILNCMRTRPLSDILSVYSVNTYLPVREPKTYLISISDSCFKFQSKNWSKSLQPVPEKYLPESEQYLPTSLLAALSSKTQNVMQVDLLLGTTDLDALNYNDETFSELLKHNASYVSDYVSSKAIPELLRMFSLYRPEVLPMLIRAIRWEYWDVNIINTGSNDEAIEQLARMETSARWGAGMALLAARLARHVARLFVYRYSFPSTIDLEGRRLNHTGKCS
ncbi:Carboxylesterase [Operophtera brumata]|uniref:Carboxylic ester hydrolase n=1 Tax=Operophtera brumata TaxID=104452 RepID=A0A0L7KL63_OPEBR|nr:Carboxylesterase [Operophtera brumata]